MRKKSHLLILATLLVTVVLGGTWLCHERQTTVQLVYYFDYADGPGLDFMLAPQQSHFPPGVTPRELLTRAKRDSSTLHDARMMISHRYSFALQNAGGKLVKWCRSVQYPSGSDPFAEPRYFQTPGWIDQLSRRDDRSKPRDLSQGELDIPLRDGDVLILVRTE